MQQKHILHQAQAFLLQVPVEHQRKNAKYIVEKNAGLYIEDKDANEKSFYETVASLMHDKSRLEELQKNSLALAKFDGTEKIVEQLKEIVK